MTIDEMRKSDKEFLVPGDICKLLHCGPQTLTLCARQKPELLGFPVVIMGTRVRIPRRAFLRFMEGRKEREGKDE